MLRLCIVDDNEALRVTLATYFEALGDTENITAGSLKELETHVNSIPKLHLAILDINLGEGQPDGLAVQQWLYQNEFKGKTIFISGHARTNPKIDTIVTTPETRFLEKPFKVKELNALIEWAKQIEIK